MAMSNEELAVLAKEDKVYADILIRKNMKLVYTIAHQFKFPGVELEDRIQEGAIGMFEAIKTFDPEKGQFSTHAVPWIRARIMKYGNEQSNTIRLPGNAVALRVKIINYVKEMSQTKGVRPSVEQIAEALGVKPDDVRHMVMINDSTIPASLDTSAHNSDGDEVNAHELLGGKLLEADIMRDDRMQRLTAVVNTMSSTSRYIASKVLGLNGYECTTFREMDNMVFSETGERMSFTAVNTRWLNIKEKLTEAFAKDKPLPEPTKAKHRVVVVVSKEMGVLYLTATPLLACTDAVKSVLQNVDLIGDILREDPEAMCLVVGAFNTKYLAEESLEGFIEDAVDLAETYGCEVMCPELAEESA